jgi:hypothetical protein
MFKYNWVLCVGYLLISCTDQSSDEKIYKITDDWYASCGHDSVKYCGNVGHLNCGVEVDGPLVIFDSKSKEVLCECSWGQCLFPDHVSEASERDYSQCEPPEWNCDK